MYSSLRLAFFVLAPVALLAACSGAASDDVPNSDDALGKKDAGAPKADAGTGGADAGQSAKMQLADVAILFPLAKTAAEIDSGYLRAITSGPRGTLLPESVYDAVGQIGGTGDAPEGSRGSAPYANLRVVAMRIDPCFGALSPTANGAGCKNQLRLVFQEVTRQGTKVTTSDSGLHAFYTLTRTELTQVARALVALRLANSKGERLGALRPHPLVASQGLGGAMGAGLRALILANVGKQNLVRITTMSGQSAGSNWTFEGFDITNATTGAVTPMVIPTLPGRVLSQEFQAGFGTIIEGEAMPSTSHADNFMPLTDGTTAPALSAAAKKSAFASLLRVENPSKHSPDTMDCVSCHLATPAKMLIAGPKLGLSEVGNPFAFVADGKWVLASEMKPSFDDPGSPPSLNVHAFSYAGTRPGISQRTVNEAAAVVVYLNEHVLP